MADDRTSEVIERLVAEEHRLLETGEQDGGLGDDDHRRLEEVRVELDRYWDLLRRRRARAEAGLPPEPEGPRDAGTVEGYLQ